MQIPKVTVGAEAEPGEGRPQGRGRESRGKLGGGGRSWFPRPGPARGAPRQDPDVHRAGPAAAVRCWTAGSPAARAGGRGPGVPVPSPDAAGHPGAHLASLPARGPLHLAALLSPPPPLFFLPSQPGTQHSPPPVRSSYPFKWTDAARGGRGRRGRKGRGTVSGSPDWPEARAAVACACALSSSARLWGVGGRPGANWPPRRPRPRVAGGHVTRRLGAPGAGDAGGQDGGGAGGGQSE